MRFILCLCALIVTASMLSACSGSKAPEEKPAATAAPAVEKPKSPHNVMVSLAAGESMTRDQQAYVIQLQDKIAAKWQPVPAKLKYSVGIEFTVTKPGLVTDVKAVSSMGSRKTIESCRDAILRADHFDALPAYFKTPPQTFLCEFMYNPQ
ncbi:MAG: hypothetical protein JSS83_00960 [Cyanobacteria bacterium SZAS LIN-3]|nr:hypothetical protein [Cyanobacteria bacterium SZAS LIN-3]